MGTEEVVPMSQSRKRLEELRAERSLTQLQLAAQAGISLSMISGIESRRNQPSVALAIKLATFFEVPVESIDWPTDEEVRAKSTRGKREAGQL
jgi:putative transcriptional regulator